MERVHLMKNGVRYILRTWDNWLARRLKNNLIWAFHLWSNQTINDFQLSTCLAMLNKVRVKEPEIQSLMQSSRKNVSVFTNC